jgi:hypothetical protein
MKYLENANVFLFLLLLLISTKTSGQYTKWEKDIEVNNVAFNKIRFIIKDGDTTYSEGYLKSKTIIEGYPCHGYIVFKKNQKLQSFTLAEKHSMLGAVLPEETEVRFYKEKILCLLGKDTEIQGYCCNGNSQRWYSMGISTVFYPNGRLKFFFPCNDILVGDVPCKSSSFAGIELYADGALKECKLSEDISFDNINYKKNTILVFDEKGKVVSTK